MARPTFEQACAQYLHRFTCEHVPAWAKKPAPGGKFYAPQYATDRQWYESTKFPGEAGGTDARAKHCYSRGETWPRGQWLDSTYVRGQ